MRHERANQARQIIESNFRIVNSPDYKTLKADNKLVPNRDYFGHACNAAGTKTVTGYTLKQAIVLECKAKTH